MSPALVAAMVFTVAMLVVTAYFFMGSVPLLILKHDTPMDARFVRGFFNVYYVAVMSTGCATALAYAIAGRPVFAAGAAALALLAAFLRRKVIATMDALRTRMEVDPVGGIVAFRRLHVAAIGINFAQLVLIVSSLIAVSMP